MVVATSDSEQSWALLVFFIFSIIKNYFVAFFTKLIWLGVGFLNRTSAEIGYYLYKKMQTNHFLLLKNFKNTESAQLCWVSRLVKTSKRRSEGRCVCVCVYVEKTWKEIVFCFVQVFAESCYGKFKGQAFPESIGKGFTESFSEKF